MIRFPKLLSFFVLFSCIFSGASICAVKSRSWKDVEGRLIEAEYVSHADDVVKLRMDGRIYSVPLSKLSVEDQEYIQEMSQEVSMEETASKSNDGVLEDSRADISFGDEDADLDIVEVRLDQRSSSRLEVTIVFDEPMAKHSEIDKVYRLWLEFDLDGDSSTGQNNYDSDLGNDLSITIFGLDTSSDWKTYNVPKSEVGKDSKIEITGIRADARELRFMIKGRDLVKDPNARFRIK